MRPTKPICSMIPCYAPDGASLGHRTLDAAQRLVSSGYVRPAYGRKGHLKAIWLLQEDGGNPLQSPARQGTRYSFIQTFETGRCWQLRRLDRRDTTTPGGSAVTARDPFLQVMRDCMAPTSGSLTASALPPVRRRPDSLAALAGG